MWARLVAASRQVPGEVSVFEGAHNYELTHEPTGIQVSYYAEEAGSLCPSGTGAMMPGRSSRRCTNSAKRSRRSRAWPGTTLNWSCRCPMLAQTELACGVFDEVAVSFARRGISSPSNG
ncbi:hypothetical protein V2I01_39830 [Micromonospora sp. BRA006-A]|nr:hypothetical protein [Micromonospora sp. BRA006-A]